MSNPAENGRDHSPDVILYQDPWRPESVEELPALLRCSTAVEHFIYREAELDEYWRCLDDETRSARTEQRRLALELMRASALRAHDLAADHRGEEAARDLEETWAAARSKLDDRRPAPDTAT
jgi:hypothetical protein